MTIKLPSRLRIGIDVGGTNTDCVLLDPTRQSSKDRGIISCAKASTTADITSGIFQVIQLVIEQSKVDAQDIALVTIGTTHFLNAIIERDASRLEKVAIIRLSSNFTRSIPPFYDFPGDLKDALYGYHAFVSGGLQIDGSLISPIDEDEILQQCEEIRRRNLTSVVIVGVYSPLDNTYNQEYSVREIIQGQLPNVRIVCSRDVGTIGFLERENASILNASILRFSEYVIKSFKHALQKLGLSCPLYLTQNDGTIVPASHVQKLPITTFSSGPTNSILGAAYLSQIVSQTSILVADVGGTSCDIGILLPSGFPKQSSAYFSIAGVRVNYSMPHVHTIGLGGGSIVTEIHQTDSISVGPESVGRSLTTNGIIFGGETLTATDIAILTKNVEIPGGQVLNLSAISPQTQTRAFEQIQSNLSRAIDTIRTSPEDMPLILVGGGSIIIGDQIKGVSEIIRPEYHEYANAVGAAVAKMASAVDTVVSTDGGLNYEQILEIKKNEAIEELIDGKGAIRESVYIADISSLPVPYAINKIRMIIKVAGEIDLNLSHPQPNGVEPDEDSPSDYDYKSFHSQRSNTSKTLAKNGPQQERKFFDVLKYKPQILNGVWAISLTDLQWISNGCYVLGCAGGGSPQCEYLEVRNILEEGHTINIHNYSDIQDTDIIAWGGIMGSPAVSYERLGGTDTVDALAEIIRYTGHKDIKALMCLEIGGANGLQSFIMASSKYFNKPLLDCDWMGRAYPTYYQTTLAAHTEGKIVPAAISDGVGNSLVLSSATSDVLSDVILRASCSEMGSRVGYAGRPTEGFLVKKYAVKSSYSLAWRIGRQIAYCQENNCIDQVADNIIQEVGGLSSARKLFTGKITSVEQKLYKGHEYGQITISSFASEEQDFNDSQIPYVKTEGILKIPYKNEIMYAEHEHKGIKTTLASVPDLISVIDSQSGQAIGVPEFKYGLRVVVIGISGSTLWSDSAKSRELGGLAAFGLSGEVKHVPLGVYTAPRSVFDEYNLET